jgi:hypothetical protein
VRHREERVRDPRPQRDLTVVVPIDRDKLTDLRQLLDDMGEDVRQQTVVPFADLTTVHYIRWVIIDPLVEGGVEVAGPSLVLSTNYDPPEQRHLEELVTVARAGLDQIYDHCVGYPEPARRSTESIIGFLRAHAVGSLAFYCGHPWRTVDQIKREAALRDDLQQHLDEVDAGAGWTGRTADEVHGELRRFAETRDDAARLSFLPRPVPRTTLKFAFALAGWILLGLVALPILIPLVLILRIKEWRDSVTDDPDGSVARDRARMLRGKMVAREDYLVQNQLTVLSVVKPGRLRKLALYLTLRVVNSLARYYYNRGHLGGIPSIHFARWIFIDGGRRLLFFSNYDGSWESYLGDFVDKASSPLTGIWSNTVGFPKARWLVGAGARDEERFKTWARSQQVRTQVWYAAYPDLSVSNVVNNSAIRRGLVIRPESKEEAEEWARRL